MGSGVSTTGTVHVVARFTEFERFGLGLGLGLGLGHCARPLQGAHELPL